MKNTIFRFWLLNILFSIVLFIIYRVVITETNHADGNFFENVFLILDAFLNVAFSFVYLLAIAFSSLSIFLNLIDKVRTNFYLSLSTFLAIPLFCVAFLAINLAIDGLLFIDTAMRNLLIFSILYLAGISVEFLLFRKKTSSLPAEKPNTKIQL